MQPPLELKLPELTTAIGTVSSVVVRLGQRVSAGEPLARVEADKTDFDILAPFGASISRIHVEVGQEISAQSTLFTLEPASSAVPSPQPEPPTVEAPKVEAPSAVSPAVAAALLPHASPTVRRAASRRGIDLATVRGSGRRGRILLEDLDRVLDGSPSPSKPAPEAPIPEDSRELARLQAFKALGEVEVVKLSRVRRVTGERLSRTTEIPQVTHFDRADITELEAFRKTIVNDKQAIKLTLLPFIMKACAVALFEHPEINASLLSEHLVVKRYVNIGVATETDDGLVVPVVRDVNALSLKAIALAVGALTTRAREKQLAPDDLRGGTFTVSSLGNVGGTAFTPLVNPPEVAILGISRHSVEPCWDGAAFQPRLMLPLSFSYDHRVIDGAAAARFVAHVAKLLGDVRRMLL